MILHIRGWLGRILPSLGRNAAAVPSFDQRYGVMIAVVGVSIMLAAALAGIIAVLNTEKMAGLQMRALQVRVGAYGIETILAKVEADERGWFLTGDEAFAQGLVDARSGLQEAVAGLAGVASTDQQRDLERIRAVVDQRIGAGLGAIARARAGERDEAVRELATLAPGDREAHAMIRRFTDANLALLSSFGNRYQASTRRLLMVLLSASLAMVFFGLHQVGSVHRLLRETASSRRQLHTANLALEDLVESRTDELSAVVQRFEVALRGAEVFVFTQDRDLRFTFASHGLLGLVPEQMVGLHDSQVLPADLILPLTTAKLRVMETGLASVDEMTLPDSRGIRRRVRLRLEPLRDGTQVAGVIGCAVDVSREHEAHRRLEAMTDELRTVVQRFEVALRSAEITVFAQDPEQHYTWASAALFGQAGEQLLGRTDADVLPAEVARRLDDLKREALVAGDLRTAELRNPAEGGDRWYSVSVEPQRDSSGVVQGLLGSALDITERRARETHNRILLRELTHRTKNLLAVVQAIARQTLTMTTSAGDFESRFSGRLQGLAASLDILFAENWEGASIAELVRSQLSHYRDYVGWRIRFHGPDLRLEPEAAQNLGLALHELCVNAAKYGALSGGEGEVDVDWELTEASDDPFFRFTWTESGGPPVRPPSRKGFGHAVLERLVPRAVGGKGKLTLRPAGVTWTLEMPAHNVRSLGEAGLPLKIWTG